MVKNADRQWVGRQELFTLSTCSLGKRQYFNQKHNTSKLNDSSRELLLQSSHRRSSAA